MAQEQSRFPRHGVYNVHPEDYSYRESSSMHAHVSSRPDIPLTGRQIVEEEFNSIRQRLIKVVHSQMASRGIPQVDDLVRDIYWETQAHDWYGDRSVWLHLPLATVFSSDVVDAIQREVLNEYPLWRVVVVHPLHDNAAFIYPWGICCDGTPDEMNGYQAAIVWQDSSINREVAEWGLIRRQLLPVREGIRKMSSKTAGPAIAIGCYKRYRKNGRQRAIWMVMTKPPGELNAFVGEQACGYPFHRRVNQRREVCPLNWRSVTARWWLVLWSASIEAGDVVSVKPRGRGGSIAIRIDGLQDISVAR